MKSDKSVFFVFVYLLTFSCIQVNQPEKDRIEKVFQAYNESNKYLTDDKLVFPEKKHIQKTLFIYLLEKNT